MTDAHRRRVAEKRGRHGERIAAIFLMLKGWRILARRVRTPRGEIDLIAKRFGRVAFVEVKQRRTLTALDQAIDERRLRRVVAAVEAIAHLYCPKGESVSIDIILVAPWRWPRHLVNIWHQ